MKEYFILILLVILFTFVKSNEDVDVWDYIKILDLLNQKQAKLQQNNNNNNVAIGGNDALLNGNSPDENHILKLMLDANGNTKNKEEYLKRNIAADNTKNDIKRKEIVARSDFIKSDSNKAVIEGSDDNNINTIKEGINPNVDNYNKEITTQQQQQQKPFKLPPFSDSDTLWNFLKPYLDMTNNEAINMQNNLPPVQERIVNLFPLNQNSTEMKPVESMNEQSNYTADNKAAIISSRKEADSNVIDRTNEGGSSAELMQNDNLAQNPQEHNFNSRNLNTLQSNSQNNPSLSFYDVLEAAQRLQDNFDQILKTTNGNYMKTLEKFSNPHNSIKHLAFPLTSESHVLVLPEDCPYPGKASVGPSLKLSTPGTCRQQQAQVQKIAATSALVPIPKPEGKPSPLPEPKPLPKPQPKPSPGPTAAASPKPGPKPSAKPSPMPLPIPSPLPGPKPRPMPSPTPEAKPWPSPQQCPFLKPNVVVTEKPTGPTGGSIGTVQSDCLDTAGVFVEKPDRINHSRKRIQRLMQELYIAQAEVQLEAEEIQRAQSIAATAQEALEEAGNNVRTVTEALHAAQQAVAMAAIRAQTAQLQLSTHDQLLFTARQRVDSLSAQLVSLQAEESIRPYESDLVGVDPVKLSNKLKSPLCEKDRPTPIPLLADRNRTLVKITRHDNFGNSFYSKRETEKYHQKSTGMSNEEKTNHTVDQKQQVRRNRKSDDNYHKSKIRKQISTISKENPHGTTDLIHEDIRKKEREERKKKNVDKDDTQLLETPVIGKNENVNNNENGAPSPKYRIALISRGVRNSKDVEDFFNLLERPQVTGGDAVATEQKEDSSLSKSDESRM